MVNKTHIQRHGGEEVLRGKFTRRLLQPSETVERSVLSVAGGAHGDSTASEAYPWRVTRYWAMYQEERRVRLR